MNKVCYACRKPMVTVETAGGVWHICAHCDRPQPKQVAA